MCDPDTGFSILSPLPCQGAPPQEEASRPTTAAQSVRDGRIEEAVPDAESSGLLGMLISISIYIYILIYIYTHTYIAIYVTDLIGNGRIRYDILWYDMT